MAIEPSLALQLIGIETQTLDKGYRLSTNVDSQSYVVVISRIPLTEFEQKFAIKVLNATLFGELMIRFETSTCMHDNWNMQSIALIWDTCDLGLTKDCKVWESDEIGKIMISPKLKKELWENIKIDAKTES